MKGFIKKIVSLILIITVYSQTAIPVFANEKHEDEIREIIYEALLGEDAVNADIALNENYKIESIKDVLGNYAYYQYDDEGINIIRNNKLDTRLTLDENENIIKYENFLNNTEINYSYDNDGNLIEIQNDDYDYEIKKSDIGVPLELRRNGELLFKSKLNDERITSKTFGNGQKVFYSYDDFGLLQSIDSDQAPLFTFEYNTDGFVEEITNQETNTSINYEYEDSNVIANYDNGTEIITTFNDLENATDKKINTTDYNYDINLKYDNDDLLNRISTSDSDFEYESNQIGFNKSITNDFDNFKEKLTPDYENEKLVGYKYISGDDTYYCVLDDNGLITEIELNGDLIYSFKYDNKFGQLIEYTDYLTDTIYTYDYDGAGNIIYKSVEYNDNIDEIEYEYNNKNWADQLSVYDNTEIEYDSIGNMIKFGNESYEWAQGNLLSSYSDKDIDVKYYYDENGVRIGKTINGEDITYIVDDYQVLVENIDGHELVYIYLYDKLLGFYYDGEIYYYKTNPLGDIIGIYNEEFDEVVTYSYDIWGNILDISGDEADTVGKYNPYRYRGYRYDEETNLYYLYSRYYNPELGRFISADCYINEPGSSVLSNNLYTYCLNNPVNYTDPYGYSVTVAIGLGATAVIGAFVLSLLTMTTIEGYCDDIASYLEDVVQDIGRVYEEYVVDLALAIALAVTKANDKTYRHPTNDHHIVAKAASRAQIARDIYNHTFGTGQLNNSRNIVTIRTSIHVVLHTNLYYDAVNNIMEYANDNNVVPSVLRNIKKTLETASKLCP